MTVFQSVQRGLVILEQFVDVGIAVDVDIAELEQGDVDVAAELLVDDAAEIIALGDRLLVLADGGVQDVTAG